MLAIDSAHYSLLEIDTIGFLLPAGEVTHIGLRNNIVRAADTSSGVLGHLPRQQTNLPLYAPNGRLRLLDHLPEERRLVACLRSRDEELAIACDAIRPFAPTNNHIRQPLPTALALSNSPIKELLLDNEQLYFITETAALIDYLSTQPIDLYEPESTSLVAER